MDMLIPRESDAVIWLSLTAPEVKPRGWSHTANKQKEHKDENKCIYNLVIGEI